jgi:hypothetical protein
LSAARGRHLSDWAFGPPSKTPIPCKSASRAYQF